MHGPQDRLRCALAQYLGHELTPERAADIERLALELPDLSIDVRALGRREHGGFVFQAEMLRDILDELHPLHVEHWQETERHRHGLGLMPDYADMLARERAGAAVQFTVRRDGALAGHCRLYLHRSIHTQTPYADEDTLFVRPQYRGGFMAVAFLRWIEEVLVPRFGLREIRADSKLINRADVLMRRRGFKPVATKFIKIFEDPNDVL